MVWDGGVSAEDGGGFTASKVKASRRDVDGTYSRINAKQRLKMRVEG